MLFNSLAFAFFLPAVFALYWALRGRVAQNVLILLASYLFYGWWDWRFLTLIAFSSLLDYGIGLGLGNTTAPRTRKLLLGLSLAGNLGLLGLFKYHDFFARSLAEAFATLGIELHPVTLGLVLPVGISFYTFQTLSYTIDVYRGTLKPVRDPVSFLAYVSFFPQLVAGPIERAADLLPQFQRDRHFDAAAATDGLRQMLWGLFKKIVVADNCARLVDEVYTLPAQQPGLLLLLGTLLFAFQIYGDFSGYSDIAIGSARLFGITLRRNFAFPYFSRDIAEFWRRWHISLSTWFRDYVYIPLGGSRGNVALRVRNTMIIFLVSGFWHGANWTFLVWGALHALFFLPLLLGGRNRQHLAVVAEGRLLPSLREAAAMLGTFLLVCLAWVFFRAANVSQAFTILRRIITRSLDARLGQLTLEFITSHLTLGIACGAILLMLALEWRQRAGHHALEQLSASRPARWAVYVSLILVIVFLGDHGAQQFIYFQF
ncbi:MAG: MBOAT family protein [Flavobacteriales bacterium]|nr:MBOAT family protein [Flavobacteriales bacterium]